MSAVLATGEGVEQSQSPPQLRYALLLEWGTWIGMAILVASFAGYVFGWLPAQVAPQDLPRFWSLPLAGYLQQTGAPVGWSWLRLLAHGDMLGLAGIAVLAGSSALALLALVPMYIAGRDRAFLVLVVLQVLVLLGAASGLAT